MAIIENPLIGRGAGKAAGVVFSVHTGDNVIRARPWNFKDRKSEQQLNLREIFTFSNKLGYQIAHLGLFNFPAGSGYIRLNSYILAKFQTCRTGSPPNYSIDFAALAWGSPSIDQGRDIAAEFTAPDQLKITWKLTPGAPQIRRDDTINLFFIHYQSGKLFFKKTVQKRNARIFEINLEEILMPEGLVYIYSNFESSAGHLFSEANFLIAR